MTNDRLSSSMRDANFKYITLNCTLMLLPRYFCLYYFSLFLSHHSYSTSLVQKQLLEQSYKGRSWWRRWRSKVVNKDWLLLQVCAQQTRARQEREREREREREIVCWHWHQNRTILSMLKTSWASPFAKLTWNKRDELNFILNLVCFHLSFSRLFYFCFCLALFISFLFLFL